MTELTTLRSATTDPVEADRLLQSADGRIAFSKDPGREFRFAVEQAGDADVQIATYRIDGSWVSQGEFDSFCVASVFRGEYEWQIDDDRDFSFRSPFLARPGHELYGHGSGLSITNVYLSRDRLQEVARTSYADDRIVLAFDSPRTLGPRQASYVLTAAKVAGEFVHAGTIANDLVRASLFHTLAVATLKCFPLTGEREERPSTPADVRRRFRRGLRFIEDNASLPITPGDIAQAAGSSLAQLDAAVREHAGMSANACLRRVRLGAARDDLRSGRADGLVSAAARWGFADAERFVRAYRAEFGSDDAIGRAGAGV
jgi:AraC-like DNA-binding protein